MRYHEITEAPLGDFAVYGDKENEGSFAASDVKAFNNPKWFTKVQSHFSRTPFTFNVYLYNAPEGKFYPYLDGYEKDKNNSTRDLQRYFKGKLTREDRAKLNQILDVEIPRSSDAINIIMTDNEGDEKFGMTPWILAHRVAHAVLQDHRAGYSAQDHSYELRRVIGTLGGVLAAAKNVAKPSEIFQFKSAQQGTVVREGEYSVEMFTQYIVRGSLTVNQPTFELPQLQPGNSSSSKAMVAAFQAEIEHLRKGGEVHNRAEIKAVIAAQMGISVEELEPLDGMVFLENYLEVQDYGSKIAALASLNRSVASANTVMASFLDECVGSTFILGAAR